MPRRRKSYNDYYTYYPPSIPIETREGIKARSKRGEFVKNWWASRWIEALERLVDPGRLSRGRRYARKGQVLSIQETKKGIEARVQGSRPTPYKITLQLKPLREGEWERVIDALAEQALFTAQLLAGVMPQEIEDVFRAAGVSLFPAKRGDLTTACSCPDWANPCKHVAATHYILGERFDEDPFLLFRLRGRSQDQILAALRLRRADQGELIDGAEPDDEPEEVVPLEETLDCFWETGVPLEEIPLTLRPPSIDMPLLRRLGEPAFAPDFDLLTSLRPAFQLLSRKALEAAYQEEPLT